MIEPKYEPIAICAENKHATLLIDRCSEIAGRCHVQPLHLPLVSVLLLLIQNFSQQHLFQNTDHLRAQQSILHRNDMICNIHELLQVVFKTPKKQHDICQENQVKFPKMAFEQNQLIEDLFKGWPSEPRLGSNSTPQIR